MACKHASNKRARNIHECDIQETETGEDLGNNDLFDIVLGDVYIRSVVFLSITIALFWWILYGDGNAVLKEVIALAGSLAALCWFLAWMLERNDDAC
jgi:hypothetical protein